MIFDVHILAIASIPLTLALAAVGTAAAGTIMTVQGQRAQAKRESQLAEYNAKIANQEAAEAEKAARFESQQHRRRAAQIIGQQKAAFGKQGTAFEGSPLLVLADTENQLNLENANIYRAGILNKGRYQQQASIYGMQAAGARAAGRYAAAGSLLMGASNTINTGYNTGLLSKAT
jgi:hypothetical protein